MNSPREIRRLLLSADWNRPLPALLTATGVNGDYFGTADRRVWAALHRRELEKAAAALERCPADDAEALSLRGRLAWLGGRDGEAHDWFDRAGGVRNPWAPGRAWWALAHLPSTEARGALLRSRWSAAWPAIWRRYGELLSGPSSPARIARVLAPVIPDGAPGGALLAGKAAARAGHSAAAVKFFDRAASLRPDAIEGFAALLGVGAALREGRTVAADSSVRAAARRRCAREPGAWWAWAVSGSCRFSGGAESPAALARARRALREARRLRPEAGWISALEAQLLWHVAFPEAVAAAARACRLSPRRGWPRAWRGILALKLGRKTAALRDFAAAERLDPDYPLTYVWRAGIHLEEGRLDAAERDLDIALALRPQQSVALERRAHVLRERGHILEALQHLTRCVSLSPETRHSFDPRAASGSIRRLERFVKVNAGEPVARFWLGELYARAGRTREAERELAAFEAAVSRAPQARVLRGWAFAWRGRLKEGRRLNPAMDWLKAC